MTFFSIIFEPAILVITAVFASFIFLTLSDYSKINVELLKVCNYLKGLNKKELSYKYNQLDEFMSANSYTKNIWEDFKKALIFPDKLYSVSKNANDIQSDVFLTMDASYFFNEETLIFSKINHKFIQTMPTILTGLGPFFTFLKMAIAFKGISFAEEVNIGTSLSGLIDNIQIAALCSVFAVGFSLTFMLIEKILYNRMCKKYYIAVQDELVRLFDVVTSEKFLIDLVMESKIQNITNEKLIKTMPEDFAKAISASLAETTTPYLENILYSLNKVNQSLNQNNGGDVVDKLF